MNRFPLWKNLLVAVVVLAGLIYSLPNLFSQDPSIEVSGVRQVQVTDDTVKTIEESLRTGGVELKRLDHEAGGRLLLRFPDSGSQLRAQDLLTVALGGDYSLAMNLVPDVPGWLKSLGAEPMYLGLDLRGGIHVVIDVDIDAAVKQAVERYDDDLRGLLRQEKVRYNGVSHDAEQVTAKFADAETRDKALKLISGEFRSLKVDAPEGALSVVVSLPDQEKIRIRKFALEQNITTLRNRVNALGVSEPVIQQQGERRIVVQLPGVQDPSRLKELLGATATLEYRLQDTEHSVEDAVDGKIPPGAKLYKSRDGRPILLKKSVIVTGNQITDASSGLDQRSGQPAVFVSLDSQGARRMRDVTTENTGKPMAVVFIENRVETKIVDGKAVKQKVLVEEVISVANILEPFGARFQTTGIDSMDEAHNLALLLRSGALAAPIEIVEERTIGPSLGQESIDKGFRAVMAGLIVVMIFMAIYYRTFGLVANLGLILNLMLLVAVLSIMQATLTLPGIAGILLTIGMAVDANVLINERIREELRIGNTPQASIHAGYEKAFGTILDANVTTLIAAVTLFSFGTGPVKGFAVVLFIGILTSMFTAITATRAVVNLIFGGKRLKELPV